MKVTSIYRKDRIGSLTHGSGNINMGSSIVTIGGLQYDTEGARSVALPAMSANTRYQVYAVINSGDVALVISQNENSVGPAGYSSWKLVGSFYSNGLASVAFGAFLSITGVPKTLSQVSWLPTGNWNVNTAYSGLYIRDGSDAIINVNLTLSGAPNAAVMRVNAPSNMLIALSEYLSSSAYIADAVGHASQGGTGYNFQIGNLTVSNMTFIYQSAVSGSQTEVNATLPFAWAAGGQLYIRNLKVPIQGWSNTAIEDL